MSPPRPLAWVMERIVHEPMSGCWLWTGSIDSEGYGRIRTTDYVPHNYAAHRATYELFVGPIPDGLQIDHLCRNRACVSPDHLEVVTTKTNTRRGFSNAGINARKTHCWRGHEFTPENTQWFGNGRICRACCRIRRASSRPSPRRGAG